MRLNFQQQRPINPTAGSPSFIPEKTTGAETEADIKIQMIRQQQEAMQDMAQAAVMIAKANQQAKEAEQQSDIADARLKINKIKENIEFGVEMNQNTTLSYMNRDETQEDTFLNKDKSGYFKFSNMQGHQKRTTEWLKKKVIADYEAEGDDKFARALEREVEFAMGNAFGNAKKSAVKHTRSALLLSVSKDNENYFRLVDQQKNISEMSSVIQARYDSIAKQLEGTVPPEDIQKSQDKWLSDSIKQVMNRLSDPNSTPADHAKYDLFLKDGLEGRGAFKNSSPLFWLNLDRDAGNRIDAMKRDRQISIHEAAIDKDPNKYIRDNLGENGLSIDVKDGKVKVTYNPLLTKNGDINPFWAKSFTDKHKQLKSTDFRRFLSRATSAIEKEENEKLGKIDFKGEERSQFFSDVEDWYNYYTTQYFTKSDGLNRTTQVLPVAPWDKPEYKDINTPEYRATVAQLKIMEGVFEEGDVLMNMSKNEINNPNKIKKRLDDLLVFVNNKAFKVYSDGVRDAGIKFVNTLQAKINATLAPLTNPLNTGKKKADVIIELNGLNPNDPMEVKKIKKLIKPPPVLKKGG